MALFWSGAVFRYPIEFSRSNLASDAFALRAVWLVEIAGLISLIPLSTTGSWLDQRAFTGVAIVDDVASFLDHLRIRTLTSSNTCALGGEAMPDSHREPCGDHRAGSRASTGHGEHEGGRCRGRRAGNFGVVTLRARGLDRGPDLPRKDRARRSRPCARLSGLAAPACRWGWHRAPQASPARPSETAV